MIESPSQQKTCILTMQAARPGGVPTLVDWWVTFITRWGHDARVLYAAFQGDGINYWQRLKLTFHTWRVHERPEHPHPTLANAPLPAPPWLFYFVPQWIFGPLLDHFDQIVVAAGPCMHALPLALRRRPYVLWLATLYEDELQGKVLLGDQWAKGVLNNPFWPFLEWQERYVLRHATRILAISPYARRRIAETLPEVAHKLDLAMVPIDESRFVPLSDSEREQQEPYILNVSRINDPRKNIPMLFEAFAQVRTRHPDLKLVLVGDDPAQPLLDDCDRLGIEDAVIFRGKVSTEELISLYQHATLFVISSTQEGLGIVMLEAMACGTPVVATDCGGPEDIVIDGQTGRMVPNNDPEALAGAITDILSSPEHLKELRQGCLDFVAANCTSAAVEKKIYRHFVEVYPESDAAKARLFDVPESEPAEDAPRKPGRLWQWLSAAWVLLVIGAYIQHQLIIHWPSIDAQIIQPLLGGF